MKDSDCVSGRERERERRGERMTTLEHNQVNERQKSNKNKERERTKKGKKAQNVDKIEKTSATNNGTTEKK